MKRSYIWLICLIVCIAFIALLYLQGSYAGAMVRMRQEQFDENVLRSIDQASRDLEKAETFRYLQTVLAQHDSKKWDAVHPDSLRIADYMPSLDTIFPGKNNMALGSLNINRYNRVAQTIANLQKHVREAFIYEQEVLDEVIYAVMYTASEQRLQERLNPAVLDGCLRNALQANGITLPFHFIVYTSDGREVYRCEDYSDVGAEQCYQQMLFRSDPTGQMGTVVIHFPDQQKYIRGVARYVAPAMGFTVIMLITSLITIYLVVRQKRISEMKNDFIHNMTHEFKTPISTISLASQMLGDESVNKSPQMLKRLANTINDEAKRLRFQVEKVLQLSMYENQKANLQMTEVNVNELISGVVHTFTLKVEKNGGKIVTHLNAEHPKVLVDEMHITNVVFNLMDNAVKYRRQDTQLELTVSTWNEPHQLCISIQDNGIGIRRDDLKKIFEKFYRVHTGNVHDVKGFGLGLAYVKKIISDHRGTVTAESELGIGTKFIITLPIYGDEMEN